MNEGASSRPLAFTINRFLAPRLLEAWRRIRFADEVADRCVAAISKRDRLGSRDRKRLAEAVFAALRRRGATDACVGLKRSNDPNHALLWLATALEQPWPDGPEPIACKNQTDDLSASANLPPFLLETLQGHFDAQTLRDLGHALLQRAPVTLRCHEPRARIAQALAEQGVVTEPCTYAPAGLRCIDGAQLHHIAASLQRRFSIQDEGSQLLAQLVGAQPGERVLDACAGAGGKTLAMLATGANIEASDIDAKRLKRLKKRAENANHQVKTTTLPPDGPLPFATSFARILIDAPCSGTGTGRRAPDLLWRFSPERLAHYCEAQERLLDRFAPLVQPGGVLVYATCSLVPAENQRQIERFLEKHKVFTLIAPSHTLGTALATKLGAESHLTLMPHKHGTDGFFGAVLRRQKTNPASD